MRILIWHGWLLEGAGSNVYTARVSAVWRSRGHDVLLVCQEPHPERFDFIDAWGAVDAQRVSHLRSGATGSTAGGRVILLRPSIGPLLPVFVYDEYEGFEVKRFVDCSAEELEAYLERNVAALKTAAQWHGSDAVIAGHAVPGPVVARRALGPRRYVAKIHGSDLEYAVRLQDRYQRLAAEGLGGALAVVGASEDVLRRTVELVPEASTRTLVVNPGVDVARFRPTNRREALGRAAERLAHDPEVGRGRPADLDDEVRGAVERRDRRALDELALRYDQDVPDPDGAARLHELAAGDGPLVGYIGKFIPQKGVHLLLAALAEMPSRPRSLLIGFGLWREWLAALLLALDSADHDAVAWLEGQMEDPTGLTADSVDGAGGLASSVAFTGRLDHRYAPECLAALDVLVVPSILDEAFAMVTAEGAAAGAMPLVARHSGLAEVAGVLEREVDRPGLFSFEPGRGATERIAAGLDRLLSLSASERGELRTAVSAAVSREWTWEQTAERLLAAARSD
jgi:glycosyltransferase involved in cell wall biosynthesis